MFQGQPRWCLLVEPYKPYYFYCFEYMWCDMHLCTMYVGAECLPGEHNPGQKHDLKIRWVSKVLRSHRPRRSPCIDPTKFYQAGLEDDWLLEYSLEGCTFLPKHTIISTHMRKSISCAGSMYSGWWHNSKFCLDGPIYVCVFPLPYLSNHMEDTSPSLHCPLFHI